MKKIIADEIFNSEIHCNHCGEQIISELQIENVIKSLKTKLISNDMIRQIYKAFEKLGAGSDLLSIIGSYKDVMSDNECLQSLIIYNNSILH